MLVNLEKVAKNVTLQSNFQMTVTPKKWKIWQKCLSMKWSSGYLK